MVVVIDAQIAGISGDMLLSALVSLGANKTKIIDGVCLAEKYLSGSKIKKINFEKIKKHGTESLELILDLEENFSERKGIEIKDCIEKSIDDIGLSMKAKSFALNSVEILMKAESKIHGVSLESVHFHEASSMDTVIDIVDHTVCHFLDRVLYGDGRNRRSMIRCRPHDALDQLC